jgi:hypothetical protein
MCLPVVATRPAGKLLPGRGWAKALPRRDDILGENVACGKNSMTCAVLICKWLSNAFFVIAQNTNLCENDDQ